MADGKIKISELSSALQINDDAVFPYSQDNSGTETTFGAEITQIARKIAEGVSLTNLQTTNKTLVSAINEIAQGGGGGGTAVVLYGTTAPTSAQGSNGNLYVQYTAGTGGADDTVDALFVKLDGAWCEIETGGGGGSGGHTIVDDSGTSLTQRTNLQFKGAYSEDNSTDDTTEVNVIRSMTKAEFDELTEAEKTGLINITDETGSGSDIINEVIFQNLGTTNPQQIDLTSAYTNYDFIVVRTYRVADNRNYIYDKLFNCNELALNSVIQDIGWFDDTNYWTYTITSETQFTFVMQGQNFYIHKIFGIKIGANSLHNYSTDEQIVGKWIDGSTLYEKTISTNSSSVDLTSLGISTLAKIEGVIQHTNGKVTPISYESGAADWAVPVYDVSSKILSLAGIGTSQGGTWTFTIRYTKTST